MKAPHVDAASAILETYGREFRFNPKTGILRFRDKKADLRSIILDELKLALPLPPIPEWPKFFIDLEHEIKTRLTPVEDDAYNPEELAKSIFGSDSLPLSETKFYLDSVKAEIIAVCRDAASVFTLNGIQSVLKVHFAKSSHATRFFQENMTTAKTIYKPRHAATFDLYDTTTKMVLNHINSWRPPEWSENIDLKHSIDVVPAGFALYEKYINAFCLRPKDRWTIEAFARDSLFDRAQTALLLVGNPGAGKNTCTQAIRGLHGSHNSINAPLHFEKSVFDSGISRGTILILDELEITEGVKRKVKNYLNDKISVERKNQNLDESIDAHMSIVCALNYIHKVSVVWSDRRFNIPQLREEDISTSIPVEEILLLQRKTTETSADYDRDLLKYLAGYLFKTYPKNSSREVDRNETFLSACIQKFKAKKLQRFLKFCQIGGQFHAAEFNGKNRANNQKMDIDQVEEFVTQFKEDFHIKLGEVSENEVGDWTFTPVKGLKLGVNLKLKVKDK